MRFVKWIGAAIVLVIVLAAAAIFLIPADQIAGLAARQFEAATGRSLTIAGPIRPSLFPTLGLSAENIEIANAPWSDEPVMARAEALRISVAFGSVFSGAPRIQGVTLVKPDLLLEKAADGRTNWTFGAPGAAPASAPAGSAGSASAPAFTLDRAEVTGGHATYRDDGSGQSYELSALDAETALTSLEHPMKVRFSASLGGETLAGDLTLADPASIFDGKGSGLSVAATLGKARASFGGAVDPSGETLLKGALEAGIPDTARTLAALGQAGVSLPKGLGQAITLKTSLGYARDKLSLDDLALTLDQNAFSGKAALDLGNDVAYLTAALSGEALDFSALSGEDGSGGSGSGSGGSSKSTGWSKEPLELSGLDALDADVSLKATSIDLGTAKFARSDIAARLKSGTLTTTLKEVQAYDGTLTGTLSLSGGQGLALGGDITATSVALQSFMRDFFDFDRILGTGDVKMTFKSRGGSMDGLVRGLNGKGRIDFGKGEIRGVDLAGMVTNLDSAFGNKAASTIFNSITATFDIEGGVVNNVDLNFLAPLFEARGEGTVGLGDQTIDYRITPKALKGDLADSKFMVPILITGSWDNLKFRPDLKAMLENDPRVKAAKEEAKAKADKAVEKAKDDAQKKIEKELKKGLGKLLGD